MRKLFWQAGAVSSVMVASFLLGATAARASIVASGGGPAITVDGFLRISAADPYGIGVPVDRDESYHEDRSDPNGNGSAGAAALDTVSGSAEEFYGEPLVAGSSAIAAYSYSFFFLDGELQSGTMLLNAGSGFAVDDTYFQSPGDFAAAGSVAQSINFMDLAISGTDYLFSFDGTVDDNVLHTQNGGGGAFFFMADITSGFAFLGLFNDATPNDFQNTAFADSYLLQANHQYRFGIGASTDDACAETAGAGICPTVNGAGDPLDVQAPGNYSQWSETAVAFSFTPIPEPGTLTLLAGGLALLALRHRA